jgi:diaminopimelate decarboxylase
MKSENSSQVKALEYNSRGELCFYGKSALALTKTWRGPTYVYSRSQIKKRAELFRQQVQAALGKAPLIHYAMKANSHPEILRLMKATKIGVDVVSGGELQKALSSGHAAKNVLFSGVGKTAPELTLAIQKKVGQINVESLPELQRLGQLTDKLKKPMGVGLRVNPEVNPVTHPYIATGFRENKFGIEMNKIDAAREILKKYKNLRFQGLSLHIGSQLFDFAALEEAILKTLDLEMSLRSQGLISQSLDIGGGIGVDYHKPAEDVDADTLARFCAVVKKTLSNYAGDVRLEPGRFLIARQGLLLTQIQYVKKTSHKNFIICDSGMNHLIRPALYQAFHRILPLKKGEESLTFDVVGPVCETADFFGRDRNLPEPVEGDFLAIADVGAYGYSMSSDYNSFPKARQIFI